MPVRERCDEAIATHAQWRVMFWQFLRGAIDLTPALVLADRACEFGQWLAASGRADLAPDDHEHLTELHARFHAVATRVVRRVHIGDTKGARDCIGPEGELNAVSNALVHSLIDVRDRPRYASRAVAPAEPVVARAMRVAVPAPIVPSCERSGAERITVRLPVRNRHHP
ncbi:MAG: CZB domain-containing protein [Deltaproteobacteria bacterium]